MVQSSEYHMIDVLNISLIYIYYIYIKYIYYYIGFFKYIFIQTTKTLYSKYSNIDAKDG